MSVHERQESTPPSSKSASPATRGHARSFRPIAPAVIALAIALGCATAHADEGRGVALFLYGPPSDFAAYGQSPYYGTMSPYDAYAQLDSGVPVDVDLLDMPLFLVSSTDFPPSQPPLPPPTRPQPGHLGVSFGGVAGTLADGVGSRLTGVQGSLRYLLDDHLALEGSFGTLASVQSNGNLTERPILARADLFLPSLFHDRVVPYLALGGGMNLLHLEIEQGQYAEDARALVGQAGAGLEVRFGAHVALDAEVSYLAARELSRGGTPSPVLSNATGPIDPALGGESGSEANLSLVVYF